MKIFFGDERKSDNVFSLVLYSVSQGNVPKIDEFLASFRLKYNLPLYYEFRNKDDSEYINNLFRSYIKENLVNTQLIEKIYFQQVSYIREPDNHIKALNLIIPETAKDLRGENARFIFDKLGGVKTETKLRTELSRLCRMYKINCNKPLKFASSHNTAQIMVADYLVAMKDKKII